MRPLAPLALLTVALVAAAAVVAVVADGVTATAVSLGLIGVAGVLAVAGFFYAVGRSEDLERERRSTSTPKPSSTRSSPNAEARPGS